ncbi:MAG: ABC transporter permease [Pseudochelatococcus sp.]|jgi:putative ABC transport system permease protein|uniref:ABC transporter permease n=1 Tax=Pseudochelatococcus sp. TaxID=2020869 RepID=UPI003D8C2FD2
MFLRMLRQSFAGNRKRKALAAVTVALSATLITTLFALSVDVGDKMASEMKAYGSNIRVTPRTENMPLIIGGRDFNPLRGRDFIDESALPALKDIFWRHNVVGFAPRLTLPVVVIGGARSLEASLIGTYFDKNVPLPDDPGYRTGVRGINPFWHVEGAWPDDEAGAGITGVLIGGGLAGRLGARVGSELTLAEPAPQAASGVVQATSGIVKVTGILATGDVEDNALVAPLGFVQKLARRPGKLQSIDVSALTVAENDLSRKASRGAEALTPEEYDVWYCTAYVSSIAHQIEEAIPGVSARPIWQVAAGEGAVIGRIQSLLFVVSVAAIAAAAMAVAALTTTTITERAGEIGLMKALGAAPWQIYLLFIGEAVIVGLIGGLIGVAAGYLMAQGVGWSVFGAGVEVRAITVPVVLATSVLTVLVGALVSSREIASLLPVEVLHGRR